MEGVVCVYLDDILIYLKTLSEHCKIAQHILERLWKHRLYLQPEKCEFEKTTIKYPRLIISEGKAKMDPVKVQGVAEWPILSNWMEVQSFLGFANFYCWFIKGFSHHAHPLFDLTKREEAWHWVKAEQSAFERDLRSSSPQHPS